MNGTFPLRTFLTAEFCNEVSNIHLPRPDLRTNPKIATLHLKSSRHDEFRAHSNRSFVDSSLSDTSSVELRLEAAIGGADHEGCSVICVYLMIYIEAPSKVRGMVLVDILTIARQYSFFSSSLSCDDRLRGACSDCSGVLDNSADLIDPRHSQKVRK
jgi:hypothetical protein